MLPFLIQTTQKNAASGFLPVLCTSHQPPARFII